MLKVGFAERSITPPDGSEIPGLFEKRIAEGVADHLYARAVVFGGARQTMAMVQVDAVAVPNEVVAAVRRRVKRETGIAPGACLIAATHTHSGGPVAGLFGSSKDPGHLDLLVRSIAAAILEAHAAQRPCYAGTAATHAPGIAFNRRFIMRDGTQVTHPGKMHPDIIEPAGPADDTVTTVGFRCAKTFRPLGCIVNFGCHATHMNGYRFSADYPRWIAESLQAVYGPAFGVVFLNAPCGDVTQMDNLSPRVPEFGEYWCERTGRAVGAAALLGLAGMDYVQRAGVAAASTRFNAAIRAAERGAVRQAHAILAGKAPDACEVDVLYARELIEVEKLRRARPRVPVEVQAMRIADALFWTVPGEMFQAGALEVRATSPFPLTCGVSLANGYLGYLCTPEAYGGGGYEVRLARSSLLEIDTASRVVKTAAGLAADLYKAARGEIRRMQQHRTWPTVADTALDGIKSLETRRRR